jgi:transcription elongation factor Elf1
MSSKQMFPCPVCAGAREVPITKKNKPYITCDPCGVQLFVRGSGGIDAFNRLACGPLQRNSFRVFSIERQETALEDI